MADLFVMCPDCGLRARLTHNQSKIIESDGKCDHRQSPMNCPTLIPVISSLLKLGPPKR
jgi:hypothetical protein